MPLFNRFSSTAYSEDYMQAQVAEYIRDSKRFRNSDYDSVTPDILREFRVPEVGRISDIVLHFTKRKIMNIECKIENYTEVYHQAKDHLSWADYSIICMPHSVYIPNTQRGLMLKYGIGLLLWVPDVMIIETINAQHNTGKDKQIRERVYKRLKASVQSIRQSQKGLWQ